MAEQTAVEPVVEVKEPEVEKPVEVTDDATGKTTADAVTFSQADVDRIVSDRLARAQTKAQQATEKATKEAERKSAEEQGKFKELYETALAEAETERASRQSLEMETLKAKVARTVGLPEKLASRLQGEDEESLTADAQSILSDLPKPVAPNINAGAGDGVVPPVNGMTPAEKQELAAIYGVNPNYLK